MGMTKEAAARLLKDDPDRYKRMGREGGKAKRPRTFDDPEKAREAARKSHEAKRKKHGGV